VLVARHKLTTWALAAMARGGVVARADRERLAAAIRSATATSYFSERPVVLLVDSSVRAFFRAQLGDEFPRLPVLGVADVPPEAHLHERHLKVSGLRTRARGGPATAPPAAPSGGGPAPGAYHP
jgi:hypothetical protein